jgi:hypothetical protein
MPIQMGSGALNTATLRAIPRLLSVALLAAACATQPRPATDAPAAGADRAAVSAPGAKPDPADLFAPADGKVVLTPEGDWFVDELGQYYLVEVARDPRYTILPQNRVMLPPGASFELVEQREDVLVVKIYNPASAAQLDPPRAVNPLKALLADLEGFRPASGDRLRLSRATRLAARGQWRQGFELADLDGDGNLDIVHGPPRKGDGRPKIFLGDGAGGWRLWREATFESPPLDYADVAVADFDGDGHLDLAFAVHLRGLIVLRGDGKGAFRRWGEGLPYWIPETLEEAPPYSSRTVAAVDWNRDGRPDLLTVGEGPRIVRVPGANTPDFQHGDRGPILFLNRGGGQWERYDQGTGKDMIFGDDLAVGDFDGDGLSDFAVASRVRGLTRLVHMGRPDGGWEEVALGELARPGSYGSVHAVDLDGDGRDEILLGYGASAGEDDWTGVDLVELEDGAWRREAVTAVKEKRGTVTALATGDVDGDGRLDVVALTGAGDRWLLLGDARGGFVREESPEMAPSEPECSGYEAAVARLGERGPSLVILAFAGEPGSEQIFPGQQKSCPSEGSFEIWSPAP